MNLHNEMIVLDYYRDLYSPNCDAAMARCLADDYVEHQYTANFTRTGLRDYALSRCAASGHEVIVHGVMSDRELVFLFVEEKGVADRGCARAELFRLADDRIAEHWGGVVKEPSRKGNDNGTFAN